MRKYIRNKVIGQYIYAKLLYIDNKEVSDLRIFLKSNGYTGGLKKKKYLEKVGVSQTYLTFIITAEKEKSMQELRELCEKLKFFEFVQVLGIIRKNSVVSDETGSKQEVSFSEENWYKKVFFSQVVIFVMWRKLLWSKKEKESGVE